MTLPLPWPKSTWLSRDVAAAKRKIPRETRLRREGKLRTFASFLLGVLDSTLGYWILIPVLILFLQIAVVTTADSRAASVENVSGWLQLAWEVEVGLVATTFVIVFFIVQAIHGAVPTSVVFDQFLRDSHLRPTASLAFTSILTLGAVTLLLASVGLTSAQLARLMWIHGILLAILVIASAWLYWVTFKLVRPEHVLQRTIDAAVDAVKRSLEEDLDRHIAESIWNKRCQELGIWVPGLRVSGARTDGDVPAREAGRIADIDLGRLRALVGRLHHGMGKGLHDSVTKAHAFVSPGQAVGVGDVILRVAPKDYSDDVAEEARRAFRIVREPTKPTGGDDRQADPAFWIDWLRDLGTQALDRGDTHRFHVARRALDDLADLVRMARAALQHAVYPGTTHSSWVDSNWRAWFAIRTAIEDLVEHAFRAGPIHLLDDAIYWPYALAQRALEAGDVEAYRSALGLYPAIYDWSVTSSDRAKSRLGRFWAHAYPGNLRYRVLAALDRAESPDDVGALGPYLYEIATRLADVAKSALDHEDTESFDETVGRLADFPGYFNNVSADEAERNSLERLEDDEVRTRELKDLDRRLALTKLRNHLILYRRMLLLALASWAMHAYERGALGRSVAQAAVTTVRTHFDRLPDLAETMLAFLDPDRPRPSPWERWDYDLRPKGTGLVMVGDWPQTWLASFYCLQGLKLSPAGGVPTIPASEHSSRLLELVRGTCERLQKEQELWSGFLEPDHLSKIKPFIRGHEVAVEEQRRREADWLIRQPVSSDKVKQFQEELEREWADHVALRSVLERAGRVVSVTGSPAGDTPAKEFDIPEQLVSKKAFVDETTAHWPPGWGRSIAESEEAYIAQVLLESLRTFETVGPNHLEAAVSRAREDLRQQGYSPSLIVLGGHFEVWQHLRPHLTTNPPGTGTHEFASLPQLQEWLDDIPVVNVWPLNEPVVMVLDTSAVGKLTQYCGPDGELFEWRLDDFATEASVDQYLEAHPGLLTDPAGNAKPREEVARALRQQVLVKVKMAIRLEVTDVNAGRLVRLDVPSE